VPATPRPPRPGDAAGEAWGIVSTLFAGMVVWGGIGWVVDRAAGTAPAFLVTGLLLGIAGALTLIMIKLFRG
jgi:ATP synthase protein I